MTIEASVTEELISAATETEPEPAPAPVARGDSRVPPLVATYRLQMRGEFPLAALRRIVPYLARLGVSHVYCSPLLMARPGSAHGYDVADPARLNPELGDDAELRALAADLDARGMGLLLDIVPNHMGIGPANPYWEELLARGRGSKHAAWFDVDWEAGTAAQRGRVVLPVLGEPLDELLEKGELAVAWDDGAWRLRYHDSHWPLAPDSLPPELAEAGDDAARGAAAKRFGAGEEGRRRLAALIDRQHYRLVFWRRAPREINYRRFFDVNELVGLRQEEPAVFEATHRRLLDWVGEGLVDGLRVDHVDGLRDPLAYLQRLRAEVERRRPRREEDALFPILVEKILSPGERLRAGWPVQGTTGYEFLNELEAVFVEPMGYASIERLYRHVAHMERLSFADVAHRGKTLVLRNALLADVLRLARLLQPLARADAAVAAYGRPALVDALTRFIARLPVYRTYVDGRGPRVHDEDRRWVDAALERVLARGEVPEPLARFLRSTLLLEGWSERADEERAAWLDFVLRFQQTSGPATAKGVEDTALYRYVPLASLNEVGGEPTRPLEDALGALHAANGERAERWPLTLLCTNTHDTKRSADVRARVDVLSEMPDRWAGRVAHWRRLNAHHRTRVQGQWAPDANTEYLLYETLAGVWPLVGGRRPEPGPPERHRLEELRARVEAYMLKAIREGKVRTSWVDPSPEFEEACKRFLHAILDAEQGGEFIGEMTSLAERIHRPGLWNALARVAVHLTSPGTPDIYQGDELWNFTLVDPDNRRPVDYPAREALLADVTAEFEGSDARRAALLREMLDRPEDGRIKLHVTTRVLRARQERKELFAAGGYRPLAATGAVGARHLVAFAREHGGAAAVTVAARFTATLCGTRPAVGECWGEAMLPLPDSLGGHRWRDVLTGREHRGSELRVAEVLGELPVAVLVGA